MLFSMAHLKPSQINSVSDFRAKTSTPACIIEWWPKPPWQCHPLHPPNPLHHSQKPLLAAHAKPSHITRFFIFCPTPSCPTCVIEWWPKPAQPHHPLHPPHLLCCPPLLFPMAHSELRHIS
jgi:hypothetical protein